jgi:hypothetical protein
MEPTFVFYIPAPVIAIGIFILIFLFNWLGYRYRKIQIRKHPEDVDSLGPMEGSLLGLMGLMLAFSFGMAASKFESRRVIIIDEANIIGTAIHMSYLYPDSTRNVLLGHFKEYVEARIGYYDAVNDPNLIKAALEKADLYSMRLLKLAIQQGQNNQNFIRTAQMIPVLNHMIDIVTTREQSRKAKVPPIILSTLMLLVFSAAFLVGYGNKAKKRNFVMVTGFALMTTLALYLILELDRPRRGIINLDEAAKNITDLRNQLTENKLATY